MKIIRCGVFETNSSSTHSLTLGVLSAEQERDEYQFETISLEPQHFGYDDIVAPMTFTNNFPAMNEICGECEHVYKGKWCYECRNPEYGEWYGEGDNKWWVDDPHKCKTYTENQNKIAERLANAQSPDERASALLTSIVCLCGRSPELVHKYFENLFSVCKTVCYRGEILNRKDNTLEFWDAAIFHGQWGEYSSRCWMETGDTSLDRGRVTEIATDVTKLKQYLFGAGAYAGGDRDG